jgi:hypothetical protein
MKKKNMAAILLVFNIGAGAQTAIASPAATTSPSTAQAAAPAPPRSTSAAQIAPGRWNVDSVLCSDLLGAADDDRAAAIMFYYGYLAAKAGIHVIDVSRIDGNVRKVMNQCAATKNITVAQAFREALGRHR